LWREVQGVVSHAPAAYGLREFVPGHQNPAGHRLLEVFDVHSGRVLKTADKADAVALTADGCCEIAFT
jgi:hypothetical protein